MISIKNLNKFFNRGKQNEIHVINDVSLDLPESGMTAIFGKSGCGKTTLLNVIGGLDSFADGSLTIEGQSIGKNTDEIRNKYIGYIFQNYNLNNSDTCFDNVASALRLCGMRDEDEIGRRVEIALRNVGMEKYGRRTPDTLSGGQQQRIAIARAIVKNPPIILADEPTGNLDEANTIMIMDLLREISRDHLVLLVTHEENLVDAYCNRIIELSDGRISSVREGSASGYSARSKQDIYLGELTKTEIRTDEISLEYYGEKTEPIDLKIVNKDGRLYLKLGTDRVHIIDGTGEVRLIDGVYHERESKENTPFDMSALPTISGEKFGRLFDLKSSVKSSYRRTIKAHSKGNKALRTMLRLFAAVTVLISAVFGSAIGQILDASDSYNHNTFYVSCEDESVSDIIHSGLGKSDSAIDFVSIYGYYPDGDDYLDFKLSAFETFSLPSYSSGLNTHGVVLDMSLTEGLEILAGSRDFPSDEYILIGDKVADHLLEITSLGYMTDYSDLIGLTCTAYNLNGKSLRVGGIVKSGEYAIYLDEMTMARYALMKGDDAHLRPASDYGIQLSDGQVIIVAPDSGSLSSAPKLGDSIAIHGHSMNVSEIKVGSDFYDEWLSLNNITKLSRDEYFSGMSEAEINEKYFEYDEYYYDRLDSFIRDHYIVPRGNITPWLYVVKGVDVKPAYYSTDYYLALEYKAKNGRYPTLAEYESSLASLPGFDYNAYYKMIDMYQNEFYAYNEIYYTTALVSDSDYIKISKLYGKNHASISEYVGYYTRYLVVHSSDPALTEAWLTEKIGHIPDGEYYKTIVTPDDIMDEVISDQSETITGTLIALVAILCVMAVCMYFIMRASLMSRIREVGIYRAIGVSKKNILFRFGVESALLSLFTVIVGYLATSIFISLSLGLSPMVEDILFYPPWYALIALVILVAMSLVSGLLPVIGLLGKTPSEILAKYDV